MPKLPFSHSDLKIIESHFVIRTENGVFEFARPMIPVSVAQAKSLAADEVRCMPGPSTAPYDWVEYPSHPDHSTVLDTVTDVNPYIVQPIRYIRQVTILLLKYADKHPWVLEALNLYTRAELTEVTPLLATNPRIASERVSLRRMNARLLKTVLDTHIRKNEARGVYRCIRFTQTYPTLTPGLAAAVIKQACRSGNVAVVTAMATHYQQEWAPLAVQAIDEVLLTDEPCLVSCLRLAPTYSWSLDHLTAVLKRPYRGHDHVIIRQLQKRPDYDAVTLIQHIIYSMMCQSRETIMGLVRYVMSIEFAEALANPDAMGGRLTALIGVWNRNFDEFPNELASTWMYGHTGLTLPLLLREGYRVSTDELWYLASVYYEDYRYDAVQWIIISDLVTLRKCDISSYPAPTRTRLQKFKALWPWSLEDKLQALLPASTNTDTRTFFADEDDDALCKRYHHLFKHGRCGRNVTSRRSQLSDEARVLLKNLYKVVCIYRDLSVLDE